MQIWNAHLTGSMRALPTAWQKLWGTCPARIITIELTKPVKRPSPSPSSSSSSAAATAMLPSMTQAEKLPLLLLQFDMHVPSCRHAPAVPLASLTATENTADSARSRGIRTKAHTTKHARSQWERNRWREEGRGSILKLNDRPNDRRTYCLSARTTKTKWHRSQNAFTIFTITIHHHIRIRIHIRFVFVSFYFKMQLMSSLL